MIYNVDVTSIGAESAIELYYISVVSTEYYTMRNVCMYVCHKQGPALHKTKPVTSMF